jgi:hypothetical protein
MHRRVNLQLVNYGYELVSNRNLRLIINVTTKFFGTLALPNLLLN